MAEKLFSLWVFLLLLHPVKPADVATPLLDEFSGGFSAAGNNLTLEGVAAIESNGVLQLTNYSSTRATGHAFYSNPFHFKNSSGEVMSFSTSFAFAIIPQPGKQGGDGLAFAISPAKGIPGGNPGSYIALFNASNNGNLSNHILAVEFDTYMNVEHGETDNNHVAVDINSVKSNKSVPVPFNLTSGLVIQAWIDYNSPTNQLDVRAAMDSTKPSSILLSNKVNLSEILNESMYIGFSAGTGMFTSSHYILGWSFNVILEIVDARLGGEFNKVEAVVVLKLGLMCSNNAPKARPTMRQAVSYLKGEVALPDAVEAPDAYDGTNGGAAASEFVDSSPTSSSAGDNRDVDLESGYSSSLFSIPR